MKILSFSIFCIVLGLFKVQAQKINLTGSVYSENSKEPLAFVAISMFNADTDTYLTYGYTDEQGTYNISFEASRFYLKAELLGYQNLESEIFQAAETNQPLILYMVEEASELDEVVVLQKKQIIQLSGDKMVVDVDRSGIGIGNDALQTLSKLPGMRLDKDENIVFRGDANLQIMIDGQPSLIKGEELKQFLKTMDGANIKSVEIIANPSAKYDASGTAGILNIKLKKGMATGLTGNVRTSVGYAEYIKIRNGINLYNSTEHWNLNFGLTHGYNEGVNHRQIIQTIVEPKQTTVLKQYNEWLPVGNNYNTNFGVSHKLNENSTIGTAINYSLSSNNDKTNGRTNEFYDALYKRYTLLKTTENSLNQSLTGNLFYSFASDSLDTKIDAQINYAHYDNTSDRITSNRYFEAETNVMYQEEATIKNDNPTLYNIVTAKVDVERKLTSNFSLESGLKYSNVNNDYDMVLKEKDGMDEFILNTNRSNHLMYKESIVSGYGIGNLTLKHYNLQAGLRAEYMTYDATSKTASAKNADAYLSLFPSFSINGSFTDNQFKFSYSRRVERPRYLYLNPFFEYIDTYNVSVGNPNLTPEFTDAFELTWLHKNKTAVSLFANFSSDEMYQIVDYDATTKITTLYYDNIGASKRIGLSLNTTVSPAKWWDIQLNGEISYAKAISELEGYRFNDSGLSFYAGFNQAFTFKNDLSFNWSGFYSASGNYGNSSFKPSYDMSLSLRKSFFSKKLRLDFSAQNVLKKSQWRQITTQGNVTTNWTNQWETRKFTLALTYNFGSGKKKDIKATDLEDEQNRL